MLRWLKNIHWPFLLSFFALTGLGILFIHSAAQYDESSVVSRQVFWVGIGFVLFFVMVRLSYRSFISTSYLLYSGAVLLLVCVLLMGKTHLGAQRWLSLGPVSIQPSEFAKLATVFVLAHFLGSHQKWEGEFGTVLKAFLLMMIPVVLIMNQPDLGTALIFFPIIIFMLFVWGIRYRYFIFAALGALLGAPVLWGMLKAYQKKRLMVFLNPELDPLGSGYTALQSRIAIGSGGLFGKGYLQGTQGQLDFIPEHHTDFIICVIGEEWGFLGTLLVLALYAMLFKAIFQVIDSTTDLKAKLLATGILAILFSQVFINIGMSFGLMPITGLTLPLISYGGSSFLVTAISLGMILSIYRERSIF